MGCLVATVFVSFNCLRHKGEHMTRDEIIAAWNAQADYMNTWQHLGEDEKLEWAMKLEREACAKVCDTTPPYPFRPSIEAAHAIRARGNT